MDPPSDDVPEPKLRPIEPESPSEEAVPMPNDDPPPVPPPPPKEGDDADVDAQLAVATDKASLAEEKNNVSAKEVPQDQSTPTESNAASTSTLNESNSVTPSILPPTPRTPPHKTEPPEQVPILSPLSQKQRSISFDELRSYEAKRRAIYLKKLKSSSLYWRAFRDTLSKSYEETERAELLIQGSMVANQNYAEYLNAAAQDRLDYGGKPMDDRKAKRFQSDKKTKYTTLGAGTMLWNMSMKDSFDNGTGNSMDSGMTSTGAVAAASRPSLLSTMSPSFEGLPEDSILTSVITCHHSMAEKFHENYTFVKDVVLEKMRALRRELESEVNFMSQLGDVTIFELDKAEDDVHKAWGKCKYIKMEMVIAIRYIYLVPAICI